MKKRNVIKKLTSVSIIILLLINLYSLVFSSDNNDKYIRIGLKRPLKSDNQVKITSVNGIEIGQFDNEFKNLFTLNDKCYTVRLDGYYDIQNEEYIFINKDNENEIKPEIGPYHIELSKTFDTYSETIKEIEKIKNLSVQAYPVYKNGFKIWIGQYPSEELAEKDIKRLKDIDEGITLVSNNDKRVVIQDEKENIILMFNVKENIYLKAKELNKEAIIGVEDNNYRDYLTFNVHENKLIVINYVKLNHYLYGVVPREMSYDWPLEALKAQAVAARNYTIVNLNKHSDLGYDLCDTQDCQVYGGYDWEHSKTNKAVKETRNKLIKYMGKPIYAYYHSSSGGHTENSENIWTSHVPYLRGVKDEFSLNSPNAEWELVLKKDEIQNELKESEINVGEVVAFEPINYSEHGRVLELKIEGTDDIEILEKEKVRYIFGTSKVKSTQFNVSTDSDVYIMDGYDSNTVKTALRKTSVITGDGTTILSKNFDKEFVITNGINERKIPVIPKTYVLKGKGWGHGLGMSQWGAKRMAELGYNYKQILEYYYTGTKVE
ncbi:SpoIID/LytB domain-containing protein [Caldisalinibacter kiritimatiensis]|uniref:Sporulation protein SpoIID n=1 Tax=Caldisalinibacter kiritimatiensis TaxID=1304284 RepID=R1AVI8_9FIRM|nr:SpoIID/LytB domain-containing protein [Caldisalinibacter kiritimatiensis]EOD00672.1 sporulation protein SpoIID [Caldisalinibacter kiritimatiensis]